MGMVAFGRFALFDGRGATIGEVLIAPECILLQRGRDTSIHDVSYVSVWSPERIDAVTRELTALGEVAPTVVDPGTPELHAILRRIEPTARATVLRVGQSRHRFGSAQRHLRAELQRRDVVARVPQGASA